MHTASFKIISALLLLLTLFRTLIAKAVFLILAPQQSSISVITSSVANLSTPLSLLNVLAYTALHFLKTVYYPVVHANILNEVLTYSWQYTHIVIMFIVVPKFFAHKM